ncbi:MAG: Acetylornithine aminotransferase [Actinomycetota bacterium]
MTTNFELARTWENLMVGNYSTPSIAIAKGEGSYVWDVEGNRYLDLLGGIAVSVLGHSHPAIVKAVSDQVSKLIHSSNLYIHETELDLAQKLTGLFSSDSKVFFCQDGATANEAALKLVRKYGLSKNQDGSKQVIIAMTNGFHGRTSGALSITGNASKRDGFGPFGYEVRFVEFNNVASLEAAMSDDVAAIFVETVQGEGGMHIGTTAFLQACQNQAHKYAAVFVVDEVQSGVGRTGSFFNFQQHGISPDIVTLAKGLAGGLPIGALIAKLEIAKHFLPGDHGSTFGGNPLSTAAANAVFNEVNQTDFLSKVLDNAKWFADAVLSLNLSIISEVRYSGLWFGIELTSDSANEIVLAAAKSGFLINAVRPNVIRLAPALNVSRNELQTFVEALPKLVS